MKRFYRSRKEKMIAGVCGGFAEYLEIDPVLVRALFIIITIAWGIGLLAYIVLWIITPYGEQNPPYEKKNDFDSDEMNDIGEPIEIVSERKKSNRQKSHIFIGYILIIIGALFLIDSLFSWISFSTIVPIIIIAIGAFIIFKSTTNNSKEL